MNQHHMQPETPSATGEGQSLDTIRKLLVGDHIAQLDARVARLESDMHTRIDAVRSHLSTSVGGVRTQLERELAEFRAHLTSESRSREEAVARVEGSLQAQKISTAGQMERLGERFDKLTSILQSKLDILQAGIDKARTTTEAEMRNQRKQMERTSLSRAELGVLLDRFRALVAEPSTPAQPAYHDRNGPPSRVQESLIVENVAFEQPGPHR